jgi:hypothetical protein
MKPPEILAPKISFRKRKIGEPRDPRRRTRKNKHGRCKNSSLLIN